MKSKDVGVKILLCLLINASSYGWNIGAKEHVNGPAIHSTYFLTPNNSLVKVYAKAYVGMYINGLCAYSEIYDIGNEQLKTGDTINLDAFALKSLIGTQFSCMTIYYQHQQMVLETFQLISDGINYIATFPPTGQMTIL